ncbi:acylphosphatase [Pullulanibacillus camelliae]|uniref:Acylphosphatase n=1 Tax=Pullulanibacillus camelliae TaxID=1707096 RepID=A0A8J2YIR5_9BACL|nr:acylphosphatase [Pullulanibacillus camelliae]GGE45299.1 acylphosphatase [Pullulanibacillus camelliae]
MEQRLHIIVKGLVQGVGFRYFTQSNAVKHQLKGWVRNLTNGDVEIDVQGASSNLEHFINAIKAGPPYGRIDAIHINDDSLPLKGYTTFNITY